MALDRVPEGDDERDGDTGIPLRGDLLAILCYESGSFIANSIVARRHFDILVFDFFGFAFRRKSRSIHV